MTVVLDMKYKIGTDSILDVIHEHKFLEQKEIASKIGVSTKTIQRRISKLKKDKLLVIHRYANNNFIYCIGGDVWLDDSYDALATARFRRAKELGVEFNIELEDEEVKGIVDDVVLFDTEVEDGMKDKGHDFRPHKLKAVAQSFEFSKTEAEYMDITVDLITESIQL